MSKALAIFASDIHLSHKAPLLRSEEPDWYDAMERALKDLGRLARKLKVPVIYAGDIFDQWKSPPELINFALQTMPKGIAIPGQHDLPNHSYEDIERSAYWTLVEAGVLENLEPGHPLLTDDLELWGFPWGHKVTHLAKELQAVRPGQRLVKIAVVHEYCWAGKYRYPHAPEENRYDKFQLGGYDAAVFGDNHQGFITDKVCNCGGFMRRHKPDLDRQPFVGVLMADMSIKKHLIDTSNDVYSIDGDDMIETEAGVDLSAFTDGLLQLRDAKDLDFGTVVTRYCKQQETSQGVLSIIKQAIEDEQRNSE